MSAIRVLAQMGIGDTAIAIPALIPVLNDPEGEVRQAACESLMQLVNDAIRAGSSAREVRAAITALIGSLKDPEPAVRVAAALALEATISSKGPAELIDVDGLFFPITEALGDSDIKVRIVALDALGRAAAKWKVKPPEALAANLADDSTRARLAAMNALACFQLDLDRWIPRIFEALEREAEPIASNVYSQSNVFQLRPPAFSSDALPTLVAPLGAAIVTFAATRAAIRRECPERPRAV
jgi:HEAT repeat protein